jgi:hypothetical protein
MTWPITWPATVDTGSLDPSIKALAELYAGACMTALTLHRAGGNPVTIMPGVTNRTSGHYAWYAPVLDEYPLGSFYPGTFYPSALDLSTWSTVAKVEAINLPGPVGAVTEVRVDGAVLDPTLYRVENGNFLVRLDSLRWPQDSGDGFTVTYLNSAPVDAMGAHAGGVMAAEWLKLLTSDKKCRLPSSVTNATRQGLTFQVTLGMFPSGVTGLPEIDAYLMLLNPFGLKVMPRVYSPDLPARRQIWHS